MPEPSAEKATKFQSSRGNCCVCGCESAGFHYGVVACEGCKAFYKRGLTKSADYKCYFGGNCAMGSSTVGRCKACRFQRCVRAGMDRQAPKRVRPPKRKNTWEHNGQTKFRKIAPAPTKASVTDPSRPVNDAEIDDPSNTRFAARYPTKFRKNGSTRAKRPISQVTSRHDKSDRAASRALVFRMKTYLSGDSSTEALALEPRKSSVSSGASSERENRPKFRYSQIDQNMSLLFSHRDVEELARFIPDTLWNLRGFCFDAHSLARPAPCAPSDYLPCLTQGLSGEVASNMPGFLVQYGRVLQEKRLFVERSVQALEDAIETIYGEDNRLYTNLMRDAVEHGLVQFQPQCTLKAMLNHLRDGQVDMLRKSFRFLTAITGFSELSAEDQQTLVKERWLETWMIVHHRFVRNGELYYTMGPDKFHFSSYWATQLFCADYLSAATDLLYEFKCLQLTQTEAFLFLAVAVFNPDTTTAKDRTSLSILHAHYLDCLLQSLRTRQGGTTERPKIVDNVLRFMSKFRIMYRISNLYVSAMDWSRIPLQAMRNGVPVSFAEVLALEDDGLQGAFVVPDG